MAEKTEWRGLALSKTSLSRLIISLEVPSPNSPYRSLPEAHLFSYLSAARKETLFIQVFNGHWTLRSRHQPIGSHSQVSKLAVLKFWGFRIPLQLLKIIRAPKRCLVIGVISVNIYCIKIFLMRYI